ncbi:hypothetical protein VPH35_082659 [Triticum aestivum]
MGNALWCCCKGEDDDDGYVYLGGDDDQHAYYYPAPAAVSRSRPHYQPAAGSSPTQGSSLRWPQSPPAPPSRPRLQLHAPPSPPPACSAAASTSRGSLTLRPQPPPAAPTPRPQRQLHAPPVPHGVPSSTSASSSSILPSQPAPVPASRPHKRGPQQPSSPVTHGHGVAVASSTSTCMLLRPQKQKPRPPPPISHGVVAVDSPASTTSCLLRFEQDLLNFVLTKMVPERLGEHVTSSKKAQAKWYRNISEAYVKTEPPPRTLAEAAMLVATALGRIQGANLEGVLAYYGFPIPMPPVVTTEHHPASLPDGVQFVLKTLPIYAKCIGDGDGFTAYVDTADPTESTNVPQEVREAVNAMLQTPKHRNSQQKNVLQSKLNKAGYRIIYTSKYEILARQYRFRLRYTLHLNINQINCRENA